MTLNSLAVQKLLERPDVQSEILFHDAGFAAAAGNKDGAIHLLEEAIRLYPENQNAVNMLERLRSSDPK
ncbi:MAG TPA: hypothetical protein VJC13_00590 [Candidatus Paceibacterota bacterium]